MPVDVLRCRVCESEYPARRQRYLRPLLRAARAGLRLGRRSPPWSRASGSRPGRSRSGATPTSCLRSRRRTPRAAPGLRRSSRRRGSRRRSASARCCSSSTSRTRRTRSRTASSRSQLPRRPSSAWTTLSATSTGNLANAVAARAAATGKTAVDLLPGRARAGEVPGDDGLRRDGLRRQRQLRRLLPARQRARRRGRLGDRQREPPLLLRGGLEDARVRDRPSSSAGRRRTPS